MTRERLEPLRRRLRDEAHRAACEPSSPVPEGLVLVMDSALEAADTRLDLCLSSCAAAEWAGGEPEEGLPGAVAALLLEAALTCHLTLPGFSLKLPSEALWLECGEASAILAGDALLPAALGYLASNCGLHSARLAAAASSLFCGGILPGFSAELALRDRKSDLGERENAWRLHAGGLARFASEAGAVLAGAGAGNVDRAAMAGLALGRAFDLAFMPGCPSRQGTTEAERVEDALSMLAELSDSLAGDPRADLFMAILDGIRSSTGGEDLFAQG